MIIFNKKQDKFLKDNYLLFPMAHLAKALNIHFKVVSRRLSELGLVVPLNIKDRFKRTHRGVNEPPPAPKKYYKQKPQKPKAAPDVKPEKSRERILKTKVVDYSTKRLVRIDHKTWVYRDK